MEVSTDSRETIAKVGSVELVAEVMTDHYFHRDYGRGMYNEVKTYESGRYYIQRDGEHEADLHSLRNIRLLHKSNPNRTTDELKRAMNQSISKQAANAEWKRYVEAMELEVSKPVHVKTKIRKYWDK